MKTIAMWTAKVIIVALSAYMILAFKIESEIDQFGVKVKSWPFADKNIKWKDIESAEVIQYGFVGGWGVRLWTKYGTVYNTGGKTGLFVKLKSGKKVLIGTRKPEELKKIYGWIGEEMKDTLAFLVVTRSQKVFGTPIFN